MLLKSDAHCYTLSVFLHNKNGKHSLTYWYSGHSLNSTILHVDTLNISSIVWYAESRDNHNGRIKLTIASCIISSDPGIGFK